VQMHVDLQQWFAGKSPAISGGMSGITLDVPTPSDGPGVADGAF
jgi:hypothetical protein